MVRGVLVAIGGLLGSVARYWLAGVVQQVSGGDFPLGTLVVNVAGSFAIGLVFALSLDRGLIDADVRVFLTTGFCGGFTTMSTFSYETMALLRDGSVMTALWNVTGTILTCFGAVWLGDLIARIL